ncbi:MAG: hypothetical protein B7Z60_02555 [Ferrovum sp. 37-45-19]|nr:MAG: hypothetical protein B7Z65_02060 [Ferrovum sp. 21-44-67]OYV95089.1 MAG: hypothetical protein B7Z60_02555 [Ferrovum sp. 37-45-19]OZB31815.1 MAG: hypothetical protein B7X47_08445 [Ferrovum sp. 34-44-207]HQT80847.1 hypothetical protein [Ferrovaceae bacterium]HQU06587.1 hypothetical protein [Ferrovaceae bacterium]
MVTLAWHVKPLTELLSHRGHFPHSLLIHGPQGIGKVEFSYSLVQSLLCLAPVNHLSCQQCVACHWVAQRQHPDLMILNIEGNVTLEEDAAEDKAKDKKSTTINVDAVRDLGPFLTVGAQRNGYKIVLIEQADALNINAANALLKALEEPPPNVLFVLVADQLKRLLPTILSRCQKLALRAPNAKESCEYLKIPESEALSLLAVYGTPLNSKRALEQGVEKLRHSYLTLLTTPQVQLTELSVLAQKIPLEYWLDWTHKWCNDLISQYFLQKRFFHIDVAVNLPTVEKVIIFDLLAWEKQLKQAKRSLRHPLVPKLLIESLLIPWLSLNRSLYLNP